MKKIWKPVYSELSCLDEDMFQAEYGNYVLDIGYYGDGYLKLYIIKNHDWEKPLEIVLFLDAGLINPLIDIFKKRLEDGYYEGNYIPNKGLKKEL